MGLAIGGGGEHLTGEELAGRIPAEGEIQPDSVGGHAGPVALEDIGEIGEMSRGVGHVLESAGTGDLPDAGVVLEQGRGVGGGLFRGVIVAGRGQVEDAVLDGEIRCDEAHRGNLDGDGRRVFIGKDFLIVGLDVLASGDGILGR